MLSESSLKEVLKCQLTKTQHREPSTSVSAISTGKKKQKLKRGFKTKKEALNFEKEFMCRTAADMKMEMNSFITVYFEDKKNELKENSIRNKQHMISKHIAPYFGQRKLMW